MNTIEDNSCGMALCNSDDNGQGRGESTNNFGGLHLGIDGAKQQQAHSPIYNKLERPVFNKLERRNHNKQSAYKLRTEWATAHSQNIVQQMFRAKAGRSPNRNIAQSNALGMDV